MLNVSESASERANAFGATATAARDAVFSARSGRFWPLQTHQPRHSLQRHHQIDQHHRREYPVGSLRHPEVAHLAEAELPLEHEEHLRGPRPVAILDLALRPGQPVLAPRQAICEVLGLLRRLFEPLSIAMVAAVTVGPRLVTAQQIGQRVLVMRVGRGEYGDVDETHLGVGAHVHLHAEMPQIALPRRFHLGITALLGVLGGTGRGNRRSINDGAARQAQPTVAQQACGIVYRLAAKVNADRTARRRRVAQRRLHRLIRHIEPVLVKVDAKHVLETDWRTPAATVGVVQLDKTAQIDPRYRRLRQREESRATRGLAVTLQPCAPIGSHRQRRLLHRRSSPQRASATTTAGAETGSVSP